MNADKLLHAISSIQNYQYTHDTSEEEKTIMNQLLKEGLAQRTIANNRYFELTTLGYEKLILA